MKKIVICISLLFTSSISTFSQGHHSFIRPILIRQVIQSDGPPNWNLSKGEKYFFNDNTTILGTTYKKVCFNAIMSLNSGPFCPTFGINGSLTYMVLFFLREDTIEKMFLCKIQ